MVNPMRRQAAMQNKHKKQSKTILKRNKRSHKGGPAMLNTTNKFRARGNDLWAHKDESCYGAKTHAQPHGWLLGTREILQRGSASYHALDEKIKTQVHLLAGHGLAHIMGVGKSGWSNRKRGIIRGIGERRAP